MARKARLSAREVKESRASELMRSMQRNLRLSGDALRAANEDAKLLGKLLAELTEKEPPPCTDSTPSNPREN